MSDLCGQSTWIELPDGDWEAHCSLPEGHPEAHRAVIFWSDAYYVDPATGEEVVDE